MLLEERFNDLTEEMQKMEEERLLGHDSKKKVKKAKKENNKSPPTGLDLSENQFDYQPSIDVNHADIGLHRGSVTSVAMS